MRLPAPNAMVGGTLIGFLGIVAAGQDTQAPDFGRAHGAKSADKGSGTGK